MTSVHNMGGTLFQKSNFYQKIFERKSNIFYALYVESKSGFPENAHIRIFGQKWAFNIVCYIHRCLSRHTIDFNGESSTSKRPWKWPWKRTNKY